MKLIRLSIAALILISGSESFAQTYGMKIGLNLVNANFHDDELSIKPILGFHIGALIDIPINEIFSFESGIFLTTKGYKNIEEDDFETKDTFSLYYLDIPLTVKLTHDLGSSKVFGTLGPYFGIGLFGWEKYEMMIGGPSPGSVYSDSWKAPIKFGSEDGQNRLDYGLSFGAGIDFNSISFGLSYDLGLASLSSLGEKNRVIRFSIGHMFNR